MGNDTENLALKNERQLRAGANFGEKKMLIPLTGRMIIMQINFIGSE
jgi:hypothetical protein